MRTPTRDVINEHVGSAWPAAYLVLLLEIFDSIDTTKPAILSGAREPGEWGDD